MTDKTISQMAAEAQALGDKTFDPGFPCKHGHTAHRYAKGTHACVMCSNLKDFNLGRKSQICRGNLILQEDGTYVGWPCRVCGQTKRNKHKKCIDCVYQKYLKNLSRANEYEKARRVRQREKFRQQAKDRYQRDKSTAMASSVVRRAQKLRAVPSWVDKEHKKNEAIL